jgi:hypothetical protein
MDSARRIKQTRTASNTSSVVRDRYYPVYEWAPTFKPLLAFMPAGSGAEDPPTVEYALLKTFADAYRVIPVANSQATW